MIKNKKAILVCSFGSTKLSAVQNTYSMIESDIKAAFPQYEVRQVYTSPTVRKILNSRNGNVIDSPEEGLDKLYNEGYTDIFIQPTFFTCGFEFDRIIEMINVNKRRFSKMQYGLPFISGFDDYDLFINAVRSIVSNDEAAYVMVGHGTKHYANSVYAALERRFRENGVKNVFIGTIEGWPDFESTAKMLNGSGFNKIILIPLLMSAGVHASEDIAGDKDSWKTKLEQLGYSVDCILHGLGEYPEIRQLIINSMKRRMSDERRERIT